MWCPSCRDEFRAEFERCAECDVALVSVPPPPVPVPVPLRAGTARLDYVLLEYDVADWTEDQRAALTLHLRLAEIPAEWDIEGLLVVGRVWKLEVDELVALIDGESSGADRWSLPAESVEEPEGLLASPGRRFLGFLVDYLVFSPVAWLLQRSVEARVAHTAVVAAVGIAYWAAPDAWWGRTVGKLVVGTRVQRLDGVRPPGWKVALVRWGTVALPGYLLIPFDLIGVWIAFAWWVSVFAPILGPSRRGIHDRFAKTVVVRVDRSGAR